MNKILNSLGQCLSWGAGLALSALASQAGAATVNQAPAITLVSPGSGLVLTAPANLTLMANASDADGSVAKVEYTQGSVPIGSAAAAPYGLTLSSLQPGTYTFTAKATDNLGASTTTAASIVTVKAADPRAPLVSLQVSRNVTTYAVPATFVVGATVAYQGASVDVSVWDGTQWLGKPKLLSDVAVSSGRLATYSFQLPLLYTGAHSIAVKAVDRAAIVRWSEPYAFYVGTNKAPTISLTSPVVGAAYTAPATVTISATAADSDGTVSSVEFYNGRTLLGRSAVAPYTYSWRNVAAGTYSVTAKATDNKGATTTSSAVSVTVGGGNKAPTISLSSPVAGAAYTAPATVTISATAADSDGTVSKVAYYNGSTLLGTSTAAPYSFSWTNVAAGTYSVTAKATDNKGATTTSAAVSVTVGAAPVAAGKLYFVHPDHLGSPRQITDQSQKTVWRWENEDAFGVGGHQEDPDGDGTRFTFNLRFAGQYHDQESGLRHNRFRDYDPATGRYVQADPIGLSGGISLYGYVSGNPLSFIDPLGLAAVPLNAQGYTVYGLFDAGASAPYYIGHTGQDMDERLGQHRGTGRAGNSTQIRSLAGEPGGLTYTQAKGSEQAYMEHYETKTGGRGNRINTINKSRVDERGLSHAKEYEASKAELSSSRSCK